jgi:hypothetical protein
VIHPKISFALSLEFFNNLIFVKFGQILTKYDFIPSDADLTLQRSEAEGIGETRPMMVRLDPSGTLTVISGSISSRPGPTGPLRRSSLNLKRMRVIKTIVHWGDLRNTSKRASHCFTPLDTPVDGRLRGAACTCTYDGCMFKCQLLIVGSCGKHSLETRYQISLPIPCRPRFSTPNGSGIPLPAGSVESYPKL